MKEFFSRIFRPGFAGPNFGKKRLRVVAGKGSPESLGFRDAVVGTALMVGLIPAPLGGVESHLGLNSLGEVMRKG